MLENFICPNGEITSVKDCFEHCQNRCLTMPTLIMASRTRKWDGKTFSVTQLLQPTLISYLKLTVPETMSPMNTLQAALGTSGHALLEGCMPRGYVGEFRMIDSNGKITGQPDCIDLKTQTLYDYKFVAAFSLAKMLGKKREGYFYEIKRGAKKGQTEWRYRWIDGGKPDYHNYDWQLNMYRILLKQNNIDIKHMVIQATAKESERQLLDLGLDRRSYLIDIPFYPDNDVLEKFNLAYDRLYDAVSTNTMPSPCDDTWNGKRCESYCSVNEHCPYYQKGKKA